MEVPEGHADGLGVDLPASDWKGQQAFHEPADDGRGELGALGHGTDRPFHDGLDEDGIQVGLVIGHEDEGAGVRDVLPAVDVQAPEEGPEKPYEGLNRAIEDHRTTMRGWNSAMSPHPRRI